MATRRVMINNKMSKLNAKQKRFCEEYIKDLNAPAAYRRAGYLAKDADVCAAKLLSQASVREYINELVAQRSKRTAIDADYVLYGIQDVVERCKQAKPVLDDEGNQTGEWRFEPNACLTGYRMLGQHLKLFTEKHEVSGPEGGPIQVAALDVHQLSDQTLKELMAAKLAKNG